MKQLFLLLLITISVTMKAQITPEATPALAGWNTDNFTTTNLGEKYVAWGYSIDTVIIYNGDWSVYRTVVLPAGYSYLPFSSNTYALVPSISDNLFNNDTLLEFLIGRDNYSYNFTVSVMNEAGQIQYTFPDSVTEGSITLYKFNGAFKINYSVYRNGGEGPLKVFTLPGTLPCNQCNYASGITEPGATGGQQGLMVYPNPFNNELEVKYNFTSPQDNARIIMTDVLGRQLKVVPLANQTDEIKISTADLPKGTLIVSLYGTNAIPASKKVIKIN